LRVEIETTAIPEDVPVSVPCSSMCGKIANSSSSFVCQYMLQLSCGCVYSPRLLVLRVKRPISAWPTQIHEIQPNYDSQLDLARQPDSLQHQSSLREQTVQSGAALGQAPTPQLVRGAHLPPPPALLQAKGPTQALVSPWALPPVPQPPQRSVADSSVLDREAAAPSLLPCVPARNHPRNRRLPPQTSLAPSSGALAASESDRPLAWLPAAQ
jgi:hypothetical protein